MPSEVDSTLDPELHPAACDMGIKTVVDVAMASSQYSLSNVGLIPGQSDHKLIHFTVE
jgi:hypothetical protein